MGDHQEGSAALPVKQQELFQQYPGVFGIQRPGGLVREDKLWLHGQRAGTGAPLLLAAGDLIGVFIKDTFNTKLAGGG